jgi:hypothetical protein
MKGRAIHVLKNEENDYAIKEFRSLVVRFPRNESDVQYTVADVKYGVCPQTATAVECQNCARQQRECVVQPRAGSTRRVGHNQSSAGPIPYSEALAKTARRRGNNFPPGYERDPSQNDCGNPSYGLIFTAIPYNYIDTRSIVFSVERPDLFDDPTYPHVISPALHAQSLWSPDRKSNYPDERAIASMTQPFSHKALNDSCPPPSTPSVPAYSTKFTPPPGPS